MNELNEKNLEDVRRLKEDVYKSWWRDGMLEISFGIAVFFVGLGYFVPNIPFLPDTFLAVFLSRLIFIAIGCSSFFWLNRKFKVQYIWGTTGYSIPASECSKAVKISILAVFLFYFFALIGKRILSSEAIILLTGSAMVFGCVALFFQSGKTKRFLFFSFLTLIIAGVAAIYEILCPQAIYIMLFILGCASLFSGFIAYRNFRMELTQ